MAKQAKAEVATEIATGPAPPVGAGVNVDAIIAAAGGDFEAVFEAMRQKASATAGEAIKAILVERDGVLKTAEELLAKAIARADLVGMKPEDRVALGLQRAPRPTNGGGKATGNGELQKAILEALKGGPLRLVDVHKAVTPNGERTSATTGACLSGLKDAGLVTQENGKGSKYMLAPAVAPAVAAQ